MALPHGTKVYAIADCKIRKMLTDVTTIPTYASSQDVPGIKKIGMAFDLHNVELRGDNRRLESDTVLLGVKVTFDHAKLHLDVLNILVGGTVTDTGTTPNQISTYKRVGTDSFNYFQMEGATPTSGVDTVGGDLHIVVNKLKVDKYDLGFAEEDYQIFSGEASGVFPISSDELFRLVMNETAAAIA